MREHEVCEGMDGLEIGDRGLGNGGLRGVWYMRVEGGRKRIGGTAGLD